jgi:hypothetical protein
MLGFEAGDNNLYRYVGNDPVGDVDPSGTDELDDLKKEMKSRFGTDDLTEIKKMLMDRRDFLVKVGKDLLDVPKECKEQAKKIAGENAKPDEGKPGSGLQGELELVTAAIDMILALERGGARAPTPVAVYESIKKASEKFMVRDNNDNLKRFPSACKCRAVEKFKEKLLIVPPEGAREEEKKGYPRPRNPVLTYPLYDPPPPKK